MDKVSVEWERGATLDFSLGRKRRKRVVFLPVTAGAGGAEGSCWIILLLFLSSCPTPGSESWRSQACCQRRAWSAERILLSSLPAVPGGSALPREGCDGCRGRTPAAFCVSYPPSDLRPKARELLTPPAPASSELGPRLLEGGLIFLLVSAWILPLTCSDTAPGERQHTSTTGK